MAKKNKLIFMTTPNLTKMLTDFEELSREGLIEAIKGALIESHNYITPMLKQQIEKHRRTGITENSLEETPRVTVEGDKIYMPLGFNLSNGGLASLFLMYGTPKMPPDTALYDAIFGDNVKKEVAKIQRNYVKKAMQKYLNGG